MTNYTIMKNKCVNKEAGFTLIELSIVLVIIGLIVGGVLVGQDLIRAAEVRAQVSQIEKLNTAVNTFRGKFNAIPGDMSYAVATQFGFTTGSNCDGSANGKRDGDGLIENSTATTGTASPVNTALGLDAIGIAGYESSLIFQDLSSSVGGNLIEGSVTNIACSSTAASSTQLSSYFPTAKIGRGQYVSVYNAAGANWWGLFGFASIAASVPVSPTTPMSVLQAYNIDKKMDDGIAATGNVVAQYMSAAHIITAAPSAATADTTHCYETTSNTYNIGQNNGAGSYCALGFRFQ